MTLDGVLLHKAGLMTGGVTGGMEAKSQKWDSRAIDCKNSVRDITFHVTCHCRLQLLVRVSMPMYVSATWRADKLLIH